MRIGMVIFYIVFAVIAFFPYYFLLRFANKMKAALISNDQDALNGSFQNLKILYRYMGILMIISLVLIVFGILSMLLTAVMMTGN
jgi:flagellar biosynthesis protein FlhB